MGCTKAYGLIDGYNMHLRMPMGLWSWSRLPKGGGQARGPLRRSLQAEDFSDIIRRFNFIQEVIELFWGSFLEWITLNPNVSKSIHVALCRMHRNVKIRN